MSLMSLMSLSMEEQFLFTKISELERRIKHLEDIVRGKIVWPWPSIPEPDTSKPVSPIPPPVRT